LNGRQTSVLAQPKSVRTIETIRPGARGLFVFKNATAVEEDDVLVAWFTDDAGFRWQLDEYLHLVTAGDGTVYLP